MEMLTQQKRCHEESKSHTIVTALDCLAKQCIMNKHYFKRLDSTMNFSVGETEEKVFKNT